MNPAIVTFDDLQAISGRKRPGDVEAWAREKRIRFERGADGKIWTTVGALDYHLIGVNSGREEIEFADG